MCTCLKRTKKTRKTRRFCLHPTRNWKWNQNRTRGNPSPNVVSDWIIIHGSTKTLFSQCTGNFTSPQCHQLVLYTFRDWLIPFLESYSVSLLWNLVCFQSTFYSFIFSSFSALNFYLLFTSVKTKPVWTWPRGSLFSHTHSKVCWIWQVCYTVKVQLLPQLLTLISRIQFGMSILPTAVP